MFFTIIHTSVSVNRVVIYALESVVMTTELSATV